MPQPLDPSKATTVSNVKEVWLASGPVQTIVEKTKPPMGFNPGKAQPVASCHTTYALPAPPLTSPLYPKLINIKNLH